MLPNSVNNHKYKDILIGATLLIGVLTLTIINWHSYEWHVACDKYNAIIYTLFLVILFGLSLDYKDLLKDRLFYLTIIINITSYILLKFTGKGTYVILILFDLSFSIYLSSKIKLSSASKKFYYVIACLIAVFFVYWTIDIKGYYKGYSTNYGGLVLISGFVFLIVIFEYFKHIIIINESQNCVLSYLKKYRFYLTFIELFLFYLGYKIMSWYQSRTAFFAMIVFGALIFTSEIILKNRILYSIVSLGSILMGCVYPFLYVYLGNRVDKNLYSLFYKPIFSGRYDIWPGLLEVFKNYKFTGIGTLYFQDNPLYRNGLFDPLNSFVDLFIVYGIIVGILVLVLLGSVLFNQYNNVKNSYIGRILYAAIITFIVVSYSESYINTIPFMSVFFLALVGLNSCGQEEYIGETNTLEYYRSLFSSDYKNNFIITIVSTFLFIFMFFIFGPIEVFCSNIDEFRFNMAAFGWFLFPVSIITITVASLIVSTFPKKINIIYSSVVFGITVASYIQYLFMNVDLVDEFGNAATVNDIGLRYYICIIIYSLIVIGLAILCVMNKKRNIIIIGSSALIMSMMLSATVSSFISTSKSIKKSPYIRVFKTDEEFQVAEDENIIVILLDTLGRYYFNEIINEWPDRYETFNDFTWYDNADSEYAPTYPSLIHLLTGIEPDKSLSKSVYEREAFSSDKANEFYSALHDNGYESMMYTREFITGEYLDNKFDNVELVQRKNKYNDIIKLITKQSMYRYVPYCLKSQFMWTLDDVIYTYVNDSDKPYTENWVAYEEIKNNGLHVNPDVSKRYIFHHFVGAHGDPTNDENCNQVPMNSVSNECAGAGSLIMVKEYFEELKKIDKYDSSSIIVMADHGSYRDNHQPIFFIKRKGETHEGVVIDSREFKYHDFNKIIMSLVE